MAVIPHLAVPLRLDGAGAFAVLEQDSDADLAQCVAVVIATPEGSRVEVPEFGAPRSDFGALDPDGIVAAVEEWEPRADVTVEVAEDIAAAQPETLTAVRVLVQPHG